MNKETLLIVLIFIFGLVLRLIFLAHIPPELNRDELSLGYNAYSVLATGRDEHSRGPWPLVFRSFGDYKLPGYIYLLIPLIKVFGLNALTIRMPSAIFGSLTILVFYFLIKEIFPKKSKLAVLCSLLLAISPFHLHYSRQAYEAMVALFLNLNATLFFLKARNNKKFLVVSLLSFILAVFIYNTPLFIFPFVVVWTIFIYKDKFFKTSQQKTFSLSFIVALAIFISIYVPLLKESNLGKTNTTIFNQVKTVELINHSIHYLNNRKIPISLARVFYNKPCYAFLEFAKNYLAAFSPKFIFLTSDNNSWHSLGYLNLGNILIVFLPFVFMGFINAIQNIKQREKLWILGCFLISPLINGATVDSPILNRLLDFHVWLILFAGVGLELFWHWQPRLYALKNKLTASLLAFFVVYYLITYFLIFPQSLPSLWIAGIKEVSQIVKQEEQQYDAIFLDSNVEVGYIYFAFYLPFNPQDFQQEAQWEFSGFDKVQSFRKYFFNKNSMELKNVGNIVTEIGKGKKTLLIQRLNPGDHPQEEKNKRFIYNSLGEPIWQLVTIIT
jgi:4-amino-4-deoxy-L-arabinose transferase-like glycosyltransferase